MTRYEWAPSAAKHRVAQRRARHVIDNATVVFPLTGDDGEPDPDLVLVVGDDPGGVPLEIVVRLLDGGAVRVIHVMKMRARYRPQYDRATR